jgi:hypothetical protein
MGELVSNNVGASEERELKLNQENRTIRISNVSEYMKYSLYQNDGREYRFDETGKTETYEDGDYLLVYRDVANIFAKEIIVNDMEYVPEDIKTSLSPVKPLEGKVKGAVKATITMPLGSVITDKYGLINNVEVIGNNVVAKRRVSGFVGIDMIAGPSEILIIADKTASPDYIAADMISQAEHDEMAACILITNSYSLAKKVKNELREQVKLLERKEIIERSLKSHGAIIITDSMKDCIDLANEIAPEHVELLTVNPFDNYSRIKNAGAIFLGANSPEPVGDYFAGTNHTLPTNSTAKFSSGLSVDDFIKKTSLIYYSREALLQNGEHIVRFAENEGLTGHANAIKIRMKRDEDYD